MKYNKEELIEAIKNNASIVIESNNGVQISTVESVKIKDGRIVIKESK